jgi:lauroyl/myristoyl acyltransferase
MKVQDNVVKDAGRLVFWYPLRWAVALLPFSAVGYIGKITGLLDYYLFRKRVESIHRNLRHVLRKPATNQEISNIVKKILSNHYALLLEFFKYPQIHAKNLASVVEVKGIENLDQALSVGRGAIIAHLHFGAKFLLIIALGLKKYPINQIAYHMPKEDLTYVRERVSLKQRLKIERGFAVNYLYLRNSLRKAFSCLENNEVLMVAIDGKGQLTEPFRGSVNADFLGRKAYFAGGVATLAKRKRTPVLPASVYRKGNGTYRVVVRPAIDVDYDRGPRQFAGEVVQRLVTIFEEDVVRFPDQWEYWEEFDYRGTGNG